MSSSDKDLTKQIFTSKKKNGNTPKRRRTLDYEEDWNPTLNEVVEEDDEGDDEEMNVSGYTGAIRPWNFHSYQRLRRPYQYELNNDANLPCFYTKIQEDAYFGYIHGCTIHKHQYINMGYMMDNKKTFGLVANLHAMGLYDFLEHKCNWNDMIVRQFYATMEIDTKKEKIEWMTGKRRYYATFDEFATANELDNGFFANSIDLNEEEPLPMEQRRQFYEPEHTKIQFKIGGLKGLRHHPAVINKIARVTFMPKGDRGEIRDKYWNVIHHIMYCNKFDVVKFMMNQLAVLKHDMKTKLYFAPYIMSLILQKTKFKGNCRVKHDRLMPFINDKEFQTRELAPFFEPSKREQRSKMVAQEGHMVTDEILESTKSQPQSQPQPQPQPQPLSQPHMHGWVPLAPNFDNFFQNMQNTWNNTFSQFGETFQQQMNQGFHTIGQQWQGHMDTSFQQFGQHLHNTMYQPIMSSLQSAHHRLHNDIDALSLQLGTLSTKEQCQQLQDRLVHLEHRFDVLNNSFNTFSDHYNTIYPRPVPPRTQFPYQPFFPPQFHPPQYCPSPPLADDGE